MLATRSLPTTVYSQRAGWGFLSNFCERGGFRQRSLLDKPIATNLLRVVNAIVHQLRGAIIGPVQHP